MAYTTHNRVAKGVLAIYNALIIFYSYQHLGLKFIIYSKREFNCAIVIELHTFFVEYMDSGIFF